MRDCVSESRAKRGNSISSRTPTACVRPARTRRRHATRDETALGTCESRSTIKPSAHRRSGVQSACARGVPYVPSPHGFPKPWIRAAARNAHSSIQTFKDQGRVPNGGVSLCA
ncbi:hypothetical protein BE221DRAFT_64788 [Ostreococcus tauri]|uniref:Uncharacterized protein n=1 Tax=Ostreococcus tauri TaxID=70448 RepID=A0A1Y5HWM7_OSTTA|nr:hypothetical protein BE221DRAFT_64788 [Ostreococcus tauri]